MNIQKRTEYSGAGPSCSVDSRFGSLPPRNNEMSSEVDRLKQLPIFGFCWYFFVSFFVSVLKIYALNLFYNNLSYLIEDL